MRRMGPLVHRSVHLGAQALVVAGAVFIAVNLLVPFGFAGFSVTANSIGDLGNPARSSWAWAFNAGAIAFGLIGLIGGFLIWTAFPLKTSRSVGLLLLEIAFASGIAVGVVPQGSSWAVPLFPAPTLDAVLAASGFGLLLLSVAMLRDTRWSGYRLYTVLSALISIVALVLLWAGAWGPLGPGGLERVALAPFLLWLLVAGVHLIRIPTYTPPGLSVTA